MCIHEQLLLIAYQFAMKYSLATLKKKKKVLQRIYLAKTQQHSLYGSK